MSENEKKFERMYWKKVQECKLLEGQSERQSSETTQVDEISSIQYVNHDRKFGRLTYKNLYFNHNSSDIDINLIDNTTKVYFKVIESYDTHFSNQAYILGIHQPLTMDMFPKLQLLSSNSSTSTSTTDIDSECSSEECNINKNITQLQLLLVQNPDLIAQLQKMIKIEKQQNESKKTLLAEWKEKVNYVSVADNKKRLEVHINADISKLKSDELKQHIETAKLYFNYKTPEIPAEFKGVEGSGGGKITKEQHKALDNRNMYCDLSGHYTNYQPQPSETKKGICKHYARTFKGLAKHLKKCSKYKAQLEEGMVQTLDIPDVETLQEESGVSLDVTPVVNKGNLWFKQKLASTPYGSSNIHKCKKCPKVFFSEEKLIEHMERECKNKEDINYWKDTEDNRMRWRRS